MYLPKLTEDSVLTDAIQDKANLKHLLIKITEPLNRSCVSCFKEYAQHF